MLLLQGAGRGATAVPVVLVFIALSGCGAKVDQRGPVPTLATADLRAFSDPDREYGASMATSDLDGDGNPELILGCPAIEAPTVGAVLVLSGVDLTIQTVMMPDPRHNSSSEPSRFGASVVSADFDRDGLPDIAVGAPSMTVDGVPGAGQVWVYLGRLGNRFPEIRTATDPRIQGGFGARLEVADLERDGNPELVVAEPGPNREGRVWVLRGPQLDSAEVFSAEVGRTGFGAVLQALHPSFAGAIIVGAPQDPDQDGGPRGAAYVLSQGDARRVQPAGSEQDFAASFAQGDFDGDGEVELVASAFGGGPALYHFETGAWDAPERRALPAGVSAGPSARLFALPDVTGDQRDELLVLGESESLVLYSPRLDQTYARLPYAVSAAVAGDFDHDGQVELLVSTVGRHHPSGISILRLVEFGIADLTELPDG